MDTVMYNAPPKIRSAWLAWGWILASACPLIDTGKANDLPLHTKASSAAKTSVAKNAVNPPPVVYDQKLIVSGNSSTQIQVTASDPGDNSLTYIITKQPRHGILSGNGPGYSFVPSHNFNGQDSFAYKVNNGKADSKTAIVNLKVNASKLNHAPEAYGFFSEALVDAKTNVYLSAYDLDGDKLRYTVLTVPRHGTLSGTDFRISYTPAVNYVGGDSFTYKANDGKLDSRIATVTLDVGPSDYDPTMPVPENISGEPGTKTEQQKSPDSPPLPSARNPQPATRNR